MRVAHYMKKPKGNESPNNIICVDVETNVIPISENESKHELVFGYACYARKNKGKYGSLDWLRFETRDEFWNWVFTKCRKNTQLTIYAHNAGFDLTVLHIWDVLPCQGFKLKTAIIESPPLCLKWVKERVSIQCIDTLNYWKMSLKQLGKYVGLEKYDMPNSWNDKELSDMYCKRDVEIIYYALMKWFEFIQVNDFGKVAITVAGQAMQAFKHKYMNASILIDDNVKALEVSRKSYRGGRVECFRIGSIPVDVHVYDVNSMYPYVMRDNVYPSRLVTCVNRLSVNDMGKAIEKGYTISANVNIETDEPAYMLNVDGRSFCPVGKFNISLSTPEIAYALAHNHIKDIGVTAIYESDPIFQNYVTDIYSLRVKAKENGDNVTDFMCKLLLNSLYGKFGQSGRRYETISETENDNKEIITYNASDPKTGKKFKVMEFCGITQIMRKEGECYESHPAISAHVTAYARMYLHKLIKTVGFDHVFYVDTDSLMVDDVGALRIGDYIDKTKLGMLKYEYTFKDLKINGAKDYEGNQIKKLKGVRSNAEWIDETTVRQEQWSSIVGLINAGDMSAPRIKNIVKHLSRVYNKGTVSEDGMVSPLVFDTHISLTE